MPVLGLTGCHGRKMEKGKLQVRPGGQAGNPISLVASLHTGKCCVPLHDITWYQIHRKERRKKFCICSGGSHTHTPRSSGAFLQDASRSRMSVFSQKRMCRGMQQTTKFSWMHLCAIIRKIRWDFLVRCVALSQNVRKNGQVSTQVGQDFPVQ